MVMCCPLTSGDDEDGAYQNYTSEIRRDTVTNRCEECGGQIEPGDDFELSGGYSTYDGLRHTHTTCLLCVEIRDHFACDGFIFGMLWEDLETNFFPDMRMGGPCMAGLSPAAKSELVAARLEWLFDGGDARPVALPPWWRWWYGEADEQDGRQ